MSTKRTLEPRVGRSFTAIAPNKKDESNVSEDKPRTIRACDACRLKKVKCETIQGYKTCRSCILSSKGCTYDIPVRKRGPPVGYTNAIMSKIRRIEAILSKTQHSNQNKNNSNDDNDASRNSIREIIQRRFLKEQEGKNNNNEFSLDKNLFINLTRAFLPYGVYLQENESRERLIVRRLEYADLDDEFDSIEDAVTATVIQSKSSIQNIEDWVQSIAGIDKDLSDRLLKVYFACIHSVVPVLNKKAFLQEYRGIGTSFPFAPLLLAIYISTIAYLQVCEKFGDAEALNDGKPWNFPKDILRKLYDRVIQYTIKRSGRTLHVVQAAVLVQICPYQGLRWEKHSFVNTGAIRMCQDLGLYRSSDILDISQDEKETRRRVWWSVYMLDRWYAAEIGRSASTLDEDCNELYPSEYADYDEVMDTMTEADQHLPRFPSLDEKTAQQYKSKKIPLYRSFVHMIKLSRILSTVLHNLYTPKARQHCKEHGSDTIISRIDNELSSWRASFPPLSEIVSVNQNNSSNEVHNDIISTSGIICLAYYTLLILLHRTFITISKDSSTNAKISAQTSLAICTNAATKVVEISERMNYKDLLLISWSYVFYPITTATFIHIFNACNPEKTVSQYAKSNLLRSLAMIDKLSTVFSSKDEDEISIRKNILKSKLCSEDPEFAQKLQSQNKDTKLRKKAIKKKRMNKSCNSSRGPSPSNSLNDLKESPDQATSIVTDGLEWLDGLYTSSQQNIQQGVFLMPSNLIMDYSTQQQQPLDMYSIRQFGFNTTDQGLTLQPHTNYLFYNENTQDPLQAVPIHNTTPSLFYDNNPLSLNASNLADQTHISNGNMLTDINCVPGDMQTNNNVQHAPLISHNSIEFLGNDLNSTFWGVPDDMNLSSLYNYIFLS